jgi:fumarate hydratase class II
MEAPRSIGYENAARIAKAAHANGTTLRTEAIRSGWCRGRNSIVWSGRAR